MTVNELIEKLQEFPGDMEVFTCGEEYEGNKLSHFAYSPYPEIKRFVKDEDGTVFVAQRACKETAGAKKGILL